MRTLRREIFGIPKHYQDLLQGFWIAELEQFSCRLVHGYFGFRRWHHFIYLLLCSCFLLIFPVDMNEPKRCRKSIYLSHQMIRDKLWFALENTSTVSR